MLLKCMNFIADHGWFFARLEIIHIYLLDFFGGAIVVDPKDYYACLLYTSDAADE